MIKTEEHFRIVILNFFITFILYSFLLWITFNFKYNWELTSRDWSYILFFSLGVNIIRSLFFWYRSKYKVLKLQKNSKEDLEKMERFISSQKVKEINSYKSTKTYKVKNKYSLIPIKFYILSEENNFAIKAPKFIIEIISKIEIIL